MLRPSGGEEQDVEGSPHGDGRGDGLDKDSAQGEGRGELLTDDLEILSAQGEGRGEGRFGDKGEDRLDHDDGLGEVCLGEQMVLLGDNVILGEEEDCREARGSGGVIRSR